MFDVQLSPHQGWGRKFGSYGKNGVPESRMACTVRPVVAWARRLHVRLAWAFCRSRTACRKAFRVARAASVVLSMSVVLQRRRGIATAPPRGSAARALGLGPRVSSRAFGALAPIDREWSARGKPLIALSQVRKRPSCESRYAIFSKFK